MPTFPALIVIVSELAPSVIAKASLEASLNIVAFVTAFFSARWRYEAIISILKERIENFKERLGSKDEMLDNYRNRLRLIPSTGTTYSSLSNSKLKKKALDLVSRIRVFLKERRTNDIMLIFNRFNKNSAKMTKEERQEAWQKETTTMSLELLKRNLQYDSQFKVDTILLRDELGNYTL